MQTAINNQLKETKLGVCASVEPQGIVWDGCDVYTARLYLWDTRFSDAALLTRWICDCGARRAIAENWHNYEWIGG
jgi:hypothetical protein